MRSMSDCVKDLNRAWLKLKDHRQNWTSVDGPLDEKHAIDDDLVEEIESCVAELPKVWESWKGSM